MGKGKDIQKVLKEINPSGGYPPGLTTKRKTWKWFGGKIDSNWGKHSGNGKYIKRQHHKAERRAVKAELADRKPRKSLYSWRSESNWKGW